MQIYLKKMIRHITKYGDFFWFRWIWYIIVFFFNENIKKSQKHDKIFLCKLFSFLDNLYTLDYKKFLLIILFKSYTAYQSLFKKRKSHREIKSLTKKKKSLSKRKSHKQNKENKLKTTVINKTICTILLLCE